MNLDVIYKTSSIKYYPYKLVREVLIFKNISCYAFQKNHKKKQTWENGWLYITFLLIIIGYP